MAGCTEWHHGEGRVGGWIVRENFSPGAQIQQIDCFLLELSSALIFEDDAGRKVPVWQFEQHVTSKHACEGTRVSMDLPEKSMARLEKNCFLKVILQRLSARLEGYPEVWIHWPESLLLRDLNFPECLTHCGADQQKGRNRTNKVNDCILPWTISECNVKGSSCFWIQKDALVMHSLTNKKDCAFFEEHENALYKAGMNQFWLYFSKTLHNH